MIISPNAAKGLALLRILVGALMAWHGLEIFDRATMQGYAGWEAFARLPWPQAGPYIGKAVELVCGLLLMVGWQTRSAALTLSAVLLAITFFVGKGRFWYEDQHPFAMGLLCLVFVFTGAGPLSVDNRRNRSIPSR